MVRALERTLSIQKSRSFHLKRMLDQIPGRQIHSLVFENINPDELVEDNNHESPKITSMDGEEKLAQKELMKRALTREKGPISRSIPSPREKQPSDLDLMKERFSKLLLGEDMSGGGKGVSSALALSNAITNLAASIFGEQRKLEPISPERKERWKKEISWLLSVTDYIVEFVPSQQISKDGVNMEIMVTRQRNDLHMNIPALRKLDTMLVECLEDFRDQDEFWYQSRDDDELDKANTQRNDDKWWLPTVKVSPNGLSDLARRCLQCQKESVNQVLKAAMAINAQVLAEMEIPESYIDTLPKNGRASLGDLIYKGITVEYFDPEQFLANMDMSTEHKVLDLKNRIEASIVIWKRKMTSKDGRSSWGSSVSMEKRELFEERAETILLLLKQRFPGISQSALDISKIQYNKDVGQAILESYSRVLESLASTVLSRIEDVLYADSLARISPQAEIETPESAANTSTSSEEAVETPNSKTLSDFMGWDCDQADANMKKNHSTGNIELYFKVENDKTASKLPPHIATPKRPSYLEKLENLSGLRSPTARH